MVECPNLNNDQLLSLEKEFSNLVLDRVIAAPYVNGAIEFLQQSSTIYDFFISSATPEYELLKIVEASQKNRRILCCGIRSPNR